MNVRGARRYRVAGLVLAIVAAGFALHRCSAPRPDGSRPAQTADARVPVTVATVKTGDFAVRVTGLGTIQPLNTVSIRPRVDGQIEQVFFKEGETVRRGDVLLDLDARPLQAALDQTLAKKAQDEANLANLELDLGRISQLATKAYATQQQLSSQQAAVTAAKALLQADDAAIENARTQLSYTEIRAPISGRIGFRQVDVGNIVRSTDQQSILTIVEVDPITVVFTLPEDTVDDVRRAMAAGAPTVAVFDRNLRTPLAEGRLTVIDNRVDPTSGTVQLKAEFANSDMHLWPGRSVTAELRLSDLVGVPIVPASAVQHGQNGLFAWIVDENATVRMRRVVLRAEADGRAAIASGLAAGDRIVTFGQYRLKEGAPVDVREAPPETPPAAGTEGASR